MPLTDQQEVLLGIIIALVFIIWAKFFEYWSG